MTEMEMERRTSFEARQDKARMKRQLQMNLRENGDGQTGMVVMPVDVARGAE